MAGTQGQDKKLSEKQQEQQAQWLEDTEMRMNAMQADAKMAGAGPVSKGVGSALKVCGCWTVLCAAACCVCWCCCL